MSDGPDAEVNNPTAIGIDLGTTFSVIAHIDVTGRPATIPNAEGDALTPSVVLFDDGMIVVGKEAVKAATLIPDKIAQSVKREMGNPTFSKAINGEFLPPEVIQSLVLEKLKRDAEGKLGPIKDVVITVPAYFNEPRRKATQDAGRMAGLNVIDIINEPTAAALAYGVQNRFLNDIGESVRPEIILVYDLGGGTFDVSLMSIDGKSYKVLATDGDVKLGGIDWDRQIADKIAEEFLRQFGNDPRLDSAGMQRLMRESEDAKRTLSARSSVIITFEHSGNALRLPFTMLEFEAMSAHLLERTRFTITNLLRQSQFHWEQITRILLVGGSTRMPMVAEMLEKESGKAVDRSLSPDEAVAHGAAIYAGLLKAANFASPPAMNVTNVNSHNLCVLATERTSGRPRSRTLIPRNTSLPATNTSTFRTLSDNQDSVVVRVVEGGDASGNNSTPIGKCVIENMPPGLPAGTKVEVTFSYGTNGRLTVHARVPDATRSAKIDIERSSGLSEANLSEWGTKVQNWLKPLNID